MLNTWQNDDYCERYGWEWRCQYYSNCWDGEPILYEPIEYKESAQ